MTNGLKFFLAFYILVGQPALLGWMLENTSLYELAGLNGLVFVISWIISAMCKSSKKEEQVENKEDNKVKLVEKSEQKVSRIENDKGVAIVQVERKEERVVATDSNENKIENQNENIESLIENTEEKLEEKSEEKVVERPMRENVSIPKIVQPLSGHQTPKKKKKELMWGQRLVLLLTLAVAAVIAGTLWEFLGNRGIAIALFLGWILYLVIGKLFDVNGFYNVKRLFTNWLYIILIIAGIGYGVYAMQDGGSFNLIKEKAASYVKDWFTSENQDDAEVDTGDIIYVFEGTGEVITDTLDDSNIGDEALTEGDEMGDGNTITGIVENSEPELNVQPEAVVQPEVNVQPEVVEEVKVENQVPVTDDPNRQVTWGEAIKHLLQGYKLSTKTDKTFVYVAKSNELYPYFKTAQEKAMIGFDVNPNKNISCETYMSLKGILEGWKVNIYDRSQTRNIYWEKANQLGKTNGCAKGSFVKVKNL